MRRPPAPVPDQRAALAALPAEAVARGRAFRKSLRPWGYASRALSLVVVLVLGLTPLGARIVGAVPGGWPGQAGPRRPIVGFPSGAGTLPGGAPPEGGP